LLKSKRAGADRYAIGVLEQVLKLWFTIDENLVCTSPELAIDNSTIDYREGSIVS
jgi:hypothetical protein